MDTIKNDAFWYLLKTKVRQEKRAKDHLERQEFEVFCPEVYIETIRRGKVSPALETLFPGYLFIKISNLSESVIAIRSTRGVSNFVSFGKSVAKVSCALIADLKKRVEMVDGNIISRLPKEGDKLSVLNGSFRGTDVIFSQPDGDERALVLMKIMNSEVSASMKYSDLSLSLMM